MNIFGSQTVASTLYNDNSALFKVTNMTWDQNARKLAANKGLAISNVTWEDCARTKGSVWGPCISDMTLWCNGHAMPVIRSPNYTDLTWDVKMEAIPLVVGNEASTSSNGNSRQLSGVSLADFLQHIGQYTGLQNSMYAAERDSHALVSTQACFLPVPAAGEADFQVGLYNYQSTKDDPAVLVAVCTSKGTSVQVSDGSRSGQKLWFNDGGVKKTFKALRLSNDRRQRGVAVEGALTQQEKQDNIVVIIQIPLKKQQPAPTVYSGLALFGASPACCPAPAAAAACYSFGSAAAMAKPAVDVEHAIVKLGEAAGPFPSLRGCDYERDASYPVRVTVQWYQCTSNGEINQEVINRIADQMEAAKTKADFWGALVTSTSSRPTEPRLNNPTISPLPFLPCCTQSPVVSLVSNPVSPKVTPTHPGVTCDNCQKNISGTVRYKCLQCPNFDLCPDCEEKTAARDGKIHPPNHLFLKMRAEAQEYGSSNAVVLNRSTLFHTGVSCSSCNAEPIVGVRYMCSVCPGVNFCEKCEVREGHEKFNHPLVKVVLPGTAPKISGLAALPAAAVAASNAAAAAAASPPLQFFGAS